MISIIIPVYNSATYLNQCIESIINQTYTDWECIIINDGSTDDSANICDIWSQTDSRIHVIHQSNQGVSASRNRGLKKSKGEYIVFVDSDDWVETNYLYDMISSMVENKTDIIVTGTNYIYKNQDVKVFKPFEKEIFRLSYENTSAFIENISLFYGPYSKLLKADIIKKYNITFPENYSLGEDLLFNFHYLSKINNIQYLSVANYNYRILNTGSLTSKYRDNEFDIHYFQWKVQRDLLISKNMWNDISMKYLYLRLWGIIYNGLFDKKKPSYSHIYKVLNIKELKMLTRWKDNFNCSKWIKFGIIHKCSAAFYLYFKLFKTNE